MIKKVDFTFLTQYELVFEASSQSNTIVYQTTYVWPKKNTKILLLEKIESVEISIPKFVEE